MNHVCRPIAAIVRQILELPSSHLTTIPYHLLFYNFYTFYLYQLFRFAEYYSYHFHLFRIGCMRPSTQVLLGLGL